MNPQDTIDQFFIKDGQLTPDGLKIKRSVLLALIEDMKYSVQLPGKWRNLGHTPAQSAHLRTMLPSFTVVSLFCTGIDVLARVTQKQLPPSRQNRAFFTRCSYDWFGLARDEVDHLWNLRNNIIHSYKLAPHSILEQYGYNRIMKSFPSGQWHYYLHAMYSSLTQTAIDINLHLSGESSTEKQRTEMYLNEFGFFYMLPTQ